MTKKQSFDESDFMSLFLRHENALRAFARSMLKDWESVDDVIQESSIVMWNKLDQLEDESGFLPWGKVIVRFKCLNYLQKKKSEKLVFSESVLKLIADDAEQIDEHTHASKRKALEQCLQKMNDSQQQLIMAPYIEHGSITTLAQKQNVSVNSLYKKLGRLREKLTICMHSRKEALP